MAEELMHANLSYEDAIQAEMKRTGKTRAQVIADGETMQADMDAKLDELIANQS